MNFTVLQEDAGMRLLAFLRKHGSHLGSIKAIKRAIDGKKCKINGRTETFSTFILKRGDTVEIELEKDEKKESLVVLFEDDFFIIYNKPAGVVSLPKNFGNKLLVHRLDKETSGIIIVAKTFSVLEKMIALFKERGVKKTYLALVDKQVQKSSGKISSCLSKKYTYQGQTIYGSSVSGQLAITEWRCIEKTLKASLIECYPITGRTHQLRVHLKEMGHPILGDTQYSRHFGCSFHAKRHLLHAFKIAFLHPITGLLMQIKSPIPLDFIEALKFCGMSHFIELLNKEEKNECRN